MVRGRREDHVQRAESIAAELCGRKSSRDPLFDLQIAEAANACYRNAASLLHDGRLLVQSSPARTLSLSVLSLEELAKIPALFVVGPETGNASWAKFWKDFASHRFKQEVAARYGQLFESKGSDLYRHPITAQLLQSLNRLKQWGLYVDSLDGRFQSPDDLASAIPPLVDYVFAAVEERIDSYGQFHVTARQSRWFLEQSRRGTGGWPPPAPTQVELAAILLSQASRLSTGEIPDYLAFYSAFDDLLDEHERDTVAGAVGSAMTVLKGRFECRPLQSSEQRAVRMFKLLTGFLTKAMPEAAEDVLASLKAHG